MPNQNNDKPVPETPSNDRPSSTDELRVLSSSLNPEEGAAFSSMQDETAENDLQTYELRTRPSGSVPPKKKKKKKRRLRKEIRYGLTAIAIVLAAWLLYSLLFKTGNSTSGEANPNQTVQNSTSTSSDNEKEGAYTVLIDPGHGGFDGGNVTDDGLYMEKELNMQIAQKVKADLEALNPNVKVVMTREDDTLDWEEDVMSDLMGRTNKQKESNADFFVSLHCNAFPGDDSVEGYTLFINSYDPFMKKLAENMDADFQAAGWSQLDGIIEDNALHVVSLASIPSILVEMGYMTNPNDMAGLADDATQETIASAIAKAINDTYLNDEAILKQTKEIYKQKQPEKDALIAQNVPEAADPSSQQPAEGQNAENQNADNQNAEGQN